MQVQKFLLKQYLRQKTFTSNKSRSINSTLTGDPKLLRNVINAKPDVMNHNIETVRRVFKKLDLKVITIFL